MITLPLLSPRTRLNHFQLRLSRCKRLNYQPEVNREY
jgi:hypothetical protein